MERNIHQSLIDWKNKKNRKPLIVRGARQVGKSFSIRYLGEKYFAGKLHEINLEKHPEFHQIFNFNFDIQRIITELELVLNTKFEIGQDLVFFDEIQACPKAIIALRYFYEETPELHVIAAGSLLEFALNEIPFPVGRVELINMYPMTFTEFLMANKHDQMATLVSTINSKKSELIHQNIINLLQKYFFIGGMPECVKSFSENQNFKEVSEIHSNLINTYRQDYLKYRPQVNTECLNSILSSVSKSVGNQLKYSKLSDGFSNPTIKKAFNLLETAKLISKIPSTSPAGIPLEAQANDKKFKAIMLDIGLMTSLSGLSVANAFQEKDLLSIFNGSMAEQFIGQELIAAGFKLYYWAREQKSSTAEVDFLIQNDINIIPIEVKSGKKGKLKSLHLLLENYSNIKRAIVFSQANFGQVDDNINFLPLYFVCSIKANTN